MIDNGPLDFYIGDQHISTGGGDKRITAKELGELFVHREYKENKEIIASLRRLVCKHPLEWNKNMYTNFRESYREQFGVPCSTGTAEYMKNVGEALDIWDGIKDINGIDNQTNLWFAHPAYFINP